MEVECLDFCFTSDIPVLELEKPATQKHHGHRPNNTQPIKARSFKPKDQERESWTRQKSFRYWPFYTSQITWKKNMVQFHPPRLSRQPGLLALPGSNEATPTHPLACSSVREDQLRQQISIKPRVSPHNTRPDHLGFHRKSHSSSRTTEDLKLNEKRQWLDGIRKNRDFKAAMIKMLQGTITNMAETNGK